jgi:DeoR family fructose operon transcriptional repressor
MIALVQNMFAPDRRKAILDLIQLNGGSTTLQLAERTGASLPTVRRDLRILQKQGLIVRTRGGAMTITHSTAYEPQYHVKVRLRQEAKEAIGRAAASLIAEGDTVIFDSGSTARSVARFARGRRMTAVALDLPIALDLADSPTVDVLVVGGQVRRELYAVVGPFAEEMLRQLHVNRLFLGADSVDLQQGIGNASPAEVPIKRLAIAAAGEVILVADSTKFGRVSLVHVCDLRKIHHVVTDAELDPGWQQALREMGIRLTLA